MNFQALSDELLSGNYARFDAAQTTQAQYWINYAYSLVWASAYWPWKVAPSIAIAATGGSRTTDLWPAGAMANLKIAYIQDDQGAPLEYLQPKELIKNFGQTTGLITGDSAARPTQWTMIGQQILWNAVPDATYAFSAVMERNIFIRTAAGAYKDGVFSTGAGTDIPAWAEPFHYPLVLLASGIGLAMENDPTVPNLLGLAQQGIDLMIQHYLPGSLTTFQFSSDDL